MERNLLDNIEEILLMGPGPSCVPPAVYRALARPTLGHLDPYFLTIMDELKILLQQIMNTENNLTVPVSGTGSAGMEACFVNLVEPGDRVLILINGVFGMRMREVASRLGADVEVMEFPWGTPVNPSMVGEKLWEGNYRLLAVVHAETSTGVANPVAEIGALPRGDDCLYLVDAVTSLGGMEVRMDAWGIDALYSGTQKCLSCPPGLAPLSFSPRAVAKERSPAQGPQLVSGPLHDHRLLGEEPGLSPHRPGQHALCPVPGLTDHLCRGSRRGFHPPPTQSCNACPGPRGVGVENGR